MKGNVQELANKEGSREQVKAIKKEKTKRKSDGRKMISAGELREEKIEGGKKQKKKNR